MKKETKYRCKVCGYETIMKLGRCPNCGSWNSFEEVENKKSLRTKKKSPVIIESLKEERIKTGFVGFDELLGGGIVRGSIILLSGEPGIGKSTLLLQIALNIAKGKGNVLYISGEESPLQISSRLTRITKSSPKNLYFLYETDIETVVNAVKELKPVLTIVDSIQTMREEGVSSLSGSPTQVRNATDKLMHIAKTHGIPIIIVGHVTKVGDIAGPKILEHLVDTVLYLEGERYQMYRILRSKKNRFGSTQELVLFSMEEEGLKEVKNPSQYFLTEREKEIPGSVILPTIESGMKPLLVEVQALVVTSYLPQPRRVSVGIDYTKLSILIAIMEKYLKLPLYKYDIYVNVTGGVKIVEPASDLPVIVSIYSSLKDIPTSNFVSFGEVGLGGEIRNVSLMKKRYKEALKLGYKNFILPSSMQKEFEKSEGGRNIFIKTVYNLIGNLK